MKKVLPRREFEAGFLGDHFRAAGNGVRGAAALLVPVGSLEQLFLLRRDEISALFLELFEHRVVDRGIDDEIAVRRAARSVIVGLADRGVLCGLDDVGGLVDHHRRVAGADAVGRFARAIRRFDHRRTAGRNRQIADRHQLVRQRNARLLDTLQDVFGNAKLLQRGAHQAHGLVGRLSARRMRREDHRVFALDRRRWRCRSA